ncbi:UBX domain-containing protein 1 [Ambystoma mexicanum]|uniref:UBX domain-containing protein 1 n=1 Tax=Ambystoma mexicanum TaxID=8296 RepID=UPI0037E88D62
MAEFSALESLLEMGFSQNRVEKALAVTGNQGIERAMDWLMEHEADPDIDEPYVPPQGNVLGTQEPPEGRIPESMGSISDPAAGGSVDESAEAKRVLTEKEREEQTRRMMELIAQKQKEREEREKRDQIEQEKQRRKQGQELSMIKQKMQEDEMKKLAEDRRREKMEEKMAKQRVREKIERDKAERAKKFGNAAAVQPSPPAEPAPPPAAPSSPTLEPPVKREYDQCRIQVRLLDGSSLTQTFRAKEQLAAVRLYVELHRQDSADPFILLTSFPRRVFTEEDMEKPLQELGLVPSAVLIVAKK